MPITAYYKLIDWWLLTLLNLLALTLVFHTYLAYVVSKTEDSPERKLTKVKPFYEIDFDDNENEQTVIMKERQWGGDDNEEGMTVLWWEDYFIVGLC